MTTLLQGRLQHFAREGSMPINDVCSQASDEIALLSDAPVVALKEMRGKLSDALNNVLCEMKSGYDDSIVGFNEAWDVMRKTFDREIDRLTKF